MTIARLFTIVSLVLAGLVAGCAGNGINPASLTADELYEQASGYYQAGNLGRAPEVFTSA